MNIFLETERLILRQFSADDADNLFELDRDPKVMRFINGGTPTEYEVIQQSRLPRIISFYQVYEHYGFWAVVEKSSLRFIGWFHFFPATEIAYVTELQLGTADVITLGYRLRRSHWGKGYATEGSRMLVSKGFSEWNIHRVISWALVMNKASTRVMEKVGLKLEKEFMFTEKHLPNLQPSERKAVKYALSLSGVSKNENYDYI